MRYLIPLLTLTACASNTVGLGASHQILLANPAAITIKYDTTIASLASVLKIAEHHCNKHGKYAVMGDTNQAEVMGLVLTKTFTCANS